MTCFGDILAENVPLLVRQISKLFGNQGFRVSKKALFDQKNFFRVKPFFKTVLKLRKKTSFNQNLIGAFLLLCHIFRTTKFCRTTWKTSKTRVARDTAFSTSLWVCFSSRQCYLCYTTAALCWISGSNSPQEYDFQ